MGEQLVRRRDRTPFDQIGRNNRLWSDGRFISSYEKDNLRDAEARLLERQREDLSGRVLELGCGAGRMTGHLARVARDLHAVDISPEMLASARRRYPDVTYHQADIADLSAFEDGGFDAIVATCNVIDVFGDADRRKLLVDLRRLLTPTGLLAFSSHNAYRDPPRPWQLDTFSPRALAAHLYHLPHNLANHVRLARHEYETDHYRLRNDAAHGWTMLLLYVTPEYQFAQLQDAGYVPLACLDEHGDEVPPEAPGDDSAELFYLARPA